MFSKSVRVGAAITGICLSGCKSLPRTDDTSADLSMEARQYSKEQRETLETRGYASLGEGKFIIPAHPPIRTAAPITTETALSNLRSDYPELDIGLTLRVEPLLTSSGQESNKGTIEGGGIFIVALPREKGEEGESK